MAKNLQGVRCEVVKNNAEKYEAISIDFYEMYKQEYRFEFCCFFPTYYHAEAFYNYLLENSKTYLKFEWDGALYVKGEVEEEVKHG